MTAFCTTDDLAAFLRVAVAPDDAGALRAIRASTAAIQNFCRQTLAYVQDDELTLDVPLGARLLFLPELPVVAVTSVVEDAADLAVTDDYKLDSLGVLHRVGRPWRHGTQLVTVTYSHGYPADYDLAGFPDDIRDVCTRAAARAYQSGLRAADTGAVPGVAGTTIGDYQVSYGSEGGAAGGMGVLGVSAAPILLRSEKDELERYRYKRPVAA